MEVLAAMLEAAGEADTMLAGRLETRLALPLAPDATTLSVVAAEGFPDPTTLEIEGERFSVTRLSPTSWTIVSRSLPPSRPTYEPGSLVIDAGRNYSDVDAARHAMLSEYARGEYLDALGGNYGLTRSTYRGVGFFLGDEKFKEVIQRLNAIAAGPMLAIITALDILFDPYVLTASTSSAAPQRLSFGSAVLPTGLWRGLVSIGGQRYRIHKIDSGGTWIDLLPFDGMSWVGANFGDATGVEVGLLMWDLWEEGNRPAEFFLRFATFLRDEPYGATYLSGGEPATSSSTTSVTVDYDIEQVLGVWLATDTERTGTDYYTDTDGSPRAGSSFTGKTITLGASLPGSSTAVVVDYGSVTPGTAQLLPDVSARNVPAGTAWPAYLADYEHGGYLRSLLDIVRQACMIPVTEHVYWSV